MDYKIVSYAPKYDSQIAEVQRHLWSAYPADGAAYFRWKYRGQPFLAEPLVQLALVAGRVVAMRGVRAPGRSTTASALRASPRRRHGRRAQHRNRGL
jgi:hypothetical protein